MSLVKMLNTLNQKRPLQTTPWVFEAITTIRHHMCHRSSALGPQRSSLSQPSAVRAVLSSDVVDSSVLSQLLLAEMEEANEKAILAKANEDDDGDGIPNKDENALCRLFYSRRFQKVKSHKNTRLARAATLWCCCTYPSPTLRPSREPGLQWDDLLIEHSLSTPARNQCPHTTLPCL